MLSYPADRSGYPRGVRNFIPIEGSKFFIEAEHVISAIGQEPDLEYLKKGDTQLEISKWNHLVVNPETLTDQRAGNFRRG